MTPDGADLWPVPIGTEDFAGGDSFPVVAPYDDRTLARVPLCGPEEVDRAVAAARRALNVDPLSLAERAAILDTCARLLSEATIQEDFARTIAGESAKPIATARAEAQRASDTFTFAAAAARGLADEVVPLEASTAGAGKLGFVLRVPIGVVGAISPFNFPLNLVAHKVAPAIAAGCPTVLKPASRTPLSALLLARLLTQQAGLPRGWLNVVTGGGGGVGAALVEHSGIALITFTGSPDVGWAIKAAAPRKRVNLELGNNAPVIIEPNGDWSAAAAKISVAGFSHAGQSCISTQRVYVHESVSEDFIAALVSAVEALVVGDPLDERTDVSTLISVSERDRVVSWIDEAVAGGATLLTGGVVSDGMLQPTVLGDVTQQMRVCEDEVFGPVVAVRRYRDFDEALALANDTRYGLQAAVFTNELAAALKAARALNFGAVLINEVPTWRADHMPYGGVGDSGNTREGPAYAVEEMTERRLIVLQP